jgi:tetratricopeptide (TPR) repeat protein
MRFRTLIIGACAMTLLLVLTSPSPGQIDSNREEKPAPAKPIQAVTAQDLSRREALTLFGLAMARQKEDRLVDAVQLLEKARQLDPDSAAIARALAPLYVALDRTQDSLSAARKAVEREPGDYESWLLLGRQYKRLNRTADAASAFDRALVSPRLEERPDLRSQIAFSLGRLREDLEQYDQAVAAYLEVVKILDQPYQLLETTGLTRDEITEQAADTYERMIRACVTAKQYERAMELYLRAEKKYPKVGPRLDLGLAKLNIARKQPELALKYVDDYLKTQPQALEAYEMRIDILGQLGRQGEVLKWLEQCVENDTHHKSLQLLLAKQYARFGRPGLAAPIYLNLINEVPDPETYRALFHLYSANREQGGMLRVLDLFDEAVARSSESAEKKKPDVMPAAQTRAMLAALRDDVDLSRGLVNEAIGRMRDGRDLQPRTLEFLAVLAARSRQLEEAERFYRLALKPPHPVNLPEQTIYQGLLEVLWEAKKYEAIVEVCRDGVAHAKGTVLLVFYDYAIRSLLNTGDYAKALEQCELAVPIAASDERNHLLFRLMRAEALSLADKGGAAVSECQALLKEYNQPDSVRRIRYTLSNVYSQMKDYPRSEEQLEIIVKADPSDAGACNNLGYSWADQNRKLPEAERLIRRALELDREEKRGLGASTAAVEQNATYLDSLGWVLFRQGKVQEAARLLEEAIKLSRGDEDPVIWDHLGDIYSRMNQVEQAQTAWKKSLKLYEIEKRRKLDDHYKELKRKLQLVKQEASPS